MKLAFLLLAAAPLVAFAADPASSDIAHADTASKQEADLKEYRGGGYYGGRGGYYGGRGGYYGGRGGYYGGRGGYYGGRGGYYGGGWRGK